MYVCVCVFCGVDTSVCITPRVRTGSTPSSMEIPASGRFSFRYTACMGSRILTCLLVSSLFPHFPFTSLSFTSPSLPHSQTVEQWTSRTVEQSRREFEERIRGEKSRRKLQATIRGRMREFEARGENSSSEFEERIRGENSRREFQERIRADNSRREFEARIRAGNLRREFDEIIRGDKSRR